MDDAVVSQLCVNLIMLTDYTFQYFKTHREHMLMERGRERERERERERKGKRERERETG